jgi:hypothetical protein
VRFLVRQRDFLSHSSIGFALIRLWIWQAICVAESLSPKQRVTAFKKRYSMKKINFILLLFLAFAILPSIALAQGFRCLSESLIPENGFNVTVSSSSLRADLIGDVGINLGRQHGPFYQVIDFFAPIRGKLETEGELKGFYNYDVSGTVANTVHFYMPDIQIKEGSFESFITVAIDPKSPTYIVLNCRFARTKKVSPIL